MRVGVDVLFVAALISEPRTVTVVCFLMAAERPECLFALSLRSVAVGVGFYGNSETNDGVYQLTYSLYNANHTLGGVDSLVG